MLLFACVGGVGGGGGGGGGVYLPCTCTLLLCIGVLPDRRESVEDIRITDSALLELLVDIKPIDGTCDTKMNLTLEPLQIVYR